MTTSRGGETAPGSRRSRFRVLASRFVFTFNVPRDAALICIAGGLRSAAVSLVGVGGSLKIVYDLVLYRSFRHLKAREELRS